MAKFGPGNPGRPSGAPNKATQEIKTAARKLVEDPTYKAELLTRLREGKCSPAVECMLYHYAYGKPAETLDIHALGLSSVWAGVLEKLPERQIIDIHARYLELESGNGNGSH